MKISLIVFAAALLVGCASSDFDSQRRSQRNLCEVMRSWEPYKPNQCGESDLTSKWRDTGYALA
jgi:hypothetical protein